MIGMFFFHVKAMNQIQEGMRILQQEAPEFLSSMSLPGFTAANAPASTAATTNPEPTGTEATTTAGTTGSGNQLEMATLMASLLNMAPPSGGANTPVSELSCAAIYSLTVIFQ